MYICECVCTCVCMYPEGAVYSFTNESLVMSHHYTQVRIRRFQYSRPTGSQSSPSHQRTPYITATYVL